MSDLGSLRQRIVTIKTELVELNKTVGMQIKIQVTLFSACYIVFIVRGDKQRQFSFITYL